MNEMNEDRELDRISRLFQRESAALRKRTLLLSAIPVVVGAIVVVSAYWGVADAREKLAELQERRDALAAEVEELLAERLELEEEVEQQTAVATAFKEQLPQDKKQTADLIQSGLDAYNQGDWQAAVETLESAVERDPNVAEVHYRLGISLFRTGKSEAALEQIQTAVELDPSYEKRARESPKLKELWNFRDLVAKPRTQAEQGGSTAEPERPEAREEKTRHIQEALESARIGSFDRAAESYGMALETDPENAELYGLRGQALFKQGDYDQAIASYQRCLELDPSLAECHFNLGLALWRNEDRKAALAAFRRTFELEPKFEERAQKDPVYGRILAELKRRPARRDDY